MDIKDFIQALFEEAEPFESVRYEEAEMPWHWRLAVAVDPERVELEYGDQQVTINLMYSEEVDFISFRILKGLPEGSDLSRVRERANILNLAEFRLSHIGVREEEPRAILNTFCVTASRYMPVLGASEFAATRHSQHVLRHREPVYARLGGERVRGAAAR